jgi:transcription antitermination factor NusG
MHGTGGVMTRYELTEREELSWQRTRKAADMVAWLRKQAAARDGERFWYAIRTRRDDADQVAKRMREAGIETWCPLTTAVKRQPRGRGCMTVSIALFPRYFFARTVSFEAAWLGLMSFEGVDCVLGHGERPVPLPERVIEDIHSFCESGLASIRKGSGILKKGDRVMIEAGPFAFLEGTVLRGTDMDGVVDLELDVFGRMTPCRIGVDDLKRLA